MNKKLILPLAGFAFIIGALLQSCNTSSEKVQIAKENVAQANEDLNEANEEYLEDMKNYEKETARKIAANEKYISDFKTQLENENKDVKAKHEKQVAELEQKNRDMETKIHAYKANGREDWEIFKKEFSRDMDELGQAFKNLTVNNTN